MMKKSRQSLHPVISDCREVEKNRMEADESDNLKSCKVAGAAVSSVLCMNISLFWV